MKQGDKIIQLDHLVHEINRTIALNKVDLDNKIYKKDLEYIENLIIALPTVPNIKDWKQKLHDDNQEFLKEHEWFRAEFTK